jgi:hypothetical protein
MKNTLAKLAIALIAGIAGMAGCGNSGPATYPVSGTVTFNGQPVPIGYIVLSPVDGKVAPDASEVIDGKFTFRARPGSKRVEITATKQSGPVDAVMNTAESLPYIPHTYNTQSVLTAEIVASDNHLDFALRSDGK